MLMPAASMCIALLCHNKSKISDLFRHSKAMHLLQSGVNLVYIRDLLGHADVSTTEVYARADEKMKREALENAYESPSDGEMPAWQKDSSLLDWLKKFGKK